MNTTPTTSQRRVARWALRLAMLTLGTPAVFVVAPGAPPSAAAALVVTSVSSYGHKVAVTSDGSLWTWGRNQLGQLGTSAGLGTADEQPPRRVMTNVRHAVAGDLMTLVLKTDGSVWAFGSNRDGRIGLPPDELPHAVPRRLMTGAKAIAAANSNSFILKTDGTLWGLGDNFAHQLGYIGPGSHEPVQVMAGVKSMSFGALGHVAAIKTDDTLWTWGWGGSGELGRSPGLVTATPAQVLTSVASVVASWSFTIALKKDGTVWTFGGNRSGELGRAAGAGTNTPQPVPTKVATGIKAISGDSGFAFMLKTDGTLLGVGSNAHGQLNPTIVADRRLYTTPVRVLTGIKLIAPNGPLAVKNDGTVWMWGVDNMPFTKVTLTLPLTKPGVIAAVVGTPGNRSVKLTWRAPAAGSKPITDYVVQYRRSTVATWSTFNDGVRSTTGATVTGLVNGATYTFRVAAKSAAGTGTYRQSPAYRPRA